MNSKLPAFMALLIALLIHAAVVNLCVFVFPIRSEPFKPKLFFLGALLKQIDVTEAPLDQNMIRNHWQIHSFAPLKAKISDVRFGKLDTKENPFTITTIQKPLMPQTKNADEKIYIKAFPDTLSADLIDPAVKAPSQDTEFRLPPYRPLHFGLR